MNVKILTTREPVTCRLDVTAQSTSAIPSADSGKIPPILSKTFRLKEKGSGLFWADLEVGECSEPSRMTLLHIHRSEP